MDAETLCSSVKNIQNVVQKTNHKYESLTDLKETRLYVEEISDIIGKLQEVTNQLIQSKLTCMKNITEGGNKYQANLKKAQHKLGDKMTLYRNPKHRYQPEKTIVDIGDNIKIKCMLYDSISDIPSMSYGAIRRNFDTLVVFKIINAAYVSCTSVKVMDFNPHDNSKTICCTNSQNCSFAHSCLFYHDPILRYDSEHVQKFIKTNLVKKNPYFGHGPYHNNSKYQLKFNDLRTLTRYCAIMLLLVKNTIVSC